MVKILPSNAGRASLIPGQGAHMPHVRKNQNTERIVTNSVRTLKMVHVKKSLKKKKRTENEQYHRNEEFTDESV